MDESGLERDNQDQNWLAPPSRERDEEERQPKRQRVDDGKGRGRNLRMFGVLANTLKTAKEQATNKTDAAKRRQEIEDRLAKERLEAAAKVDKEITVKKLDRQLKSDIIGKEESKTILSAVYATRHTAAIQLAGFLCTSYEPSTATTADSTLRPPIEASRPLAIGPSFKSTPRPVYYLPAKLLPAQREKIDAQIEATKQAIEKDTEAWDDERRERTRELVQLRERRNENKEAMRANAEANGDTSMQAADEDEEGHTASRERSNSKSRSASPGMQVDRSPTLA